jgi:hypothetical protein
MPALRRRTPSILIAAILLVWAAAAASQSTDWCAEGNLGRNQHCEVRQLRFPMSAGDLLVDAGANGSIRVEAYNGTEVRVTARVVARAGSARAAADLAQRVELRTGGGEVRATGPRTSGNQSWTVSYRILVPAGIGIDARTTNGSVSITGTGAPVRVRTTNGAITVSDASGRIDLGTTNGRVNAAFAPSMGSFDGVRIRSTNGGVQLTLPSRISAQLELSTTNGNISTAFPITVQGRINRRQISAAIGGGGPEINIGTTNGNISIASH